MPKPIQIAIMPASQVGLGCLFVLLSDGVIWKGAYEGESVSWNTVEGPWIKAEEESFCNCASGLECEQHPRDQYPSLKPLEIMQDVADRLASWGFTATMEHPGYVAVAAKGDPFNYVAGVDALDENWNICLLDAEGNQETPADLGVPAQSDDVTKIAEAIAAYLERA